MTPSRDKKPKTFFFTRLNSPLGKIILTSDGTAICGLYLPKHPDYLKAQAGTLKPALFRRAVKQLKEYFQGTRKEFALTVKLQGTVFQRKVWRKLRTLDYGTTLSYGGIAKRIKNSGASRAVGLASRKNPISIIIPCHRVVGTGGKLTGYSGGLPSKKFLLDLESS